jgi:capsular exopolysaccharide synthesis family protein
MSKIFDALNKTRTETAAAFVRAMSDSPAAPPEDLDESSPSQIRADELGPEVRGPGLPLNEHVDDRRIIEENVYPLRLESHAPLLPFEEIPNRTSEEYRIIRTRIFQHPKRPRVIVVSSAGAADGKSITAINLAGVLALKSDAKVLLLDADFRRCSIALKLGLPSTPGLADVLTGKCGLEAAMIRAEQMPNFYIMPAGECRCNPAELLDSPVWLQTYTTVRARFGHIILDSPPIHGVADYELIQAAADGVVAVVRPDHTKRSSLDAALKTIPSEKLIGIVMNCVSDWFLTRRQHYSFSYSSPPGSRVIV